MELRVCVGHKKIVASRTDFRSKSKRICQNGVNERPDHLLTNIPAPLIEVNVKHTDAHNRARSCVYPAALGTFLTHVVAVRRLPLELTTY